MPEAIQQNPIAQNSIPSAHDLSIQEIGEILDSDIESGLSSSAREQRFKEFGKNEIREREPDPAWKKFLRQFKELVIWILIVAAIISGIVGDWPDAFAILAIVLLNAILGFVQEERAQRALGALRKLSQPQAKVFEGGELISVPVSDIVPGDLIQMEAGDYVPADCRLIETFNFNVQEASLTGESAPVIKDAKEVLSNKTSLGDRKNMGYFGTIASTGKARGLVIHTGMQTELGKIAGLLNRYKPDPTPLQLRLNQLGKILVVVCLLIVALIFVLQFIRQGEFLEVFIMSLSLAVAAVPEGLPAVVTIALALGLRRMVKRNALVRELPSVETLGSVSIICSDKTGTLTRNEMTVREVYTGDKHIRVSGTGYRPHGDFFIKDNQDESQGNEEQIKNPSEDIELSLLLKIGSQCNNSKIIPPSGDSQAWQVIGDPTEGALEVLALKGHVDPAPANCSIKYEIPFDSTRKAMSVVLVEGDENQKLLTKGAVEVLLSKSNSFSCEGVLKNLKDDDKKQFLQIAEDMASRSLRVLGFAYKDLSTDDYHEDIENDLVFVGLVGMIDPPREEVKVAVETCKKAGIRPIMITGDHPSTGRAIAKELMILTEGGLVVTGEELDHWSQEDLVSKVKEVSVYARVSPQHKLRVVQAWKSLGHVVAMTGDGVNDAPAVKEANIGIAMGITGTDVTKEASDMVLMDDNFSSIVCAVEEGRGIYDNIQKFVRYLLSCNAGEILLMLFAALKGWPAPLIAIQILWINLVTDGLPALALAMEPPEKDIMNRAPRKLSAQIIDFKQGLSIISHGLLIAISAIIGFSIVYSGEPESLPQAQTVAFCIVAFSQLVYSLSCRSQKQSFIRLGWFSNPYLWGAIAISAMLQLAVITMPFAQPIFKVSSLSLIEAVYVAGLSIAPILIIETWRCGKSWRNS